MIKSISDLSLDEITWFTAKIDGFTWARNGSKRSGDSYKQKGEKSDWELGTRAFICRSKAKDLDKNIKNWDGWFRSDLTEPLAKAAYYDVPKYVTSWVDSGPLLEQAMLRGMLIESIDWDRYDNLPRFKASYSKWENCYRGNTFLEAGLRCYIASVYGEELSVDQFYDAPQVPVFIKIVKTCTGNKFPYGNLGKENDEFVTQFLGSIFPAVRSNMNYYKLPNGMLVHVYNSFEVKVPK